MDLAALSQALDMYVRTDTPAVAVRLLDAVAEIPERAKMPVRDFKARMPLCQGMALARRHGVVVAMGADDMLCPLGAVATGLLPAKDGFLDGRFGIPYWVPDQETAAWLSASVPRVQYGRHTHVVVAPLERATFEPHVVVVYGNPAQIGRMLQAVVYVIGAPVHSQSIGGIACAEQIARTMLTGQSQVVVAGGGERILALTQDHEASLALPATIVDAFAEALGETQKRGSRYPTRSWLTFGASMPPAFDRMTEYLRGDET
jgi:uncharacterized protein (DUF169 family)